MITKTKTKKTEIGFLKHRSGFQIYSLNTFFLGFIWSNLFFLSYTIDSISLKYHINSYRNEIKVIFSISNINQHIFKILGRTS